MNNSNELSTKLVQSLPTECKQAVEKYGGQYALFLDKYPTLQNRTDAITSVYDSVARGTSRAYGDKSIWFLFLDTFVLIDIFKIKD